MIKYLFDHSGIFEVFCNVKSATNEIDHVVKLSNQGMMLVKKLGEDIFGLNENEKLVLSECKNYSQKVGVTYLMKFYSLLKISDVSLGFFFATKGITGKEDSYEDGYGYLKSVRILEKYGNGKEFYILPFDFDDLESINSAYDFFELIKTKKIALQLSALNRALRSREKHPNEDSILNAVKEL